MMMMMMMMKSTMNIHVRVVCVCVRSFILRSGTAAVFASLQQIVEVW